jgi:hypothetical protein
MTRRNKLTGGARPVPVAGAGRFSNWIAWAAMLAAAPAALAQPTPPPPAAGSLGTVLPGDPAMTGDGLIVGDLGPPMGELGPPMYEPAAFGGPATYLPTGGVLEDGRNWAHAQYLLMWDNGTELPPLVTTSPPATPREDSGVLGLPSTRVIFGAQDVDDNPLSGLHLSLGRWYAGQRYGVGLEYFMVGDRENSFRATGNDFPILARPFFNVASGEQDALLLAFPDEIEGGVDIQSAAQFDSWAAYLRYLRRQGCNYRIDGILGWRHMSLDQSLDINNQLEFVDPDGDVPVGTLIRQNDSFEVDNEFHGVELGVLGHSRSGCWSLDFALKVALGNVNRKIHIDGRTVTAVPDADPTSALGGLLTQRSNIGTFEDDEFSVVPQAMASVGYQISPRVAFHVGYNFLYLDNVLHPGDVIDPSINLTQQGGQLVGAARPRVELENGDYWLQGLLFGLNMDF